MYDNINIDCHEHELMSVVRHKYNVKLGGNVFSMRYKMDMQASLG